MPLPSTPLTIHGGCSCKTLRYKLEIPEASERPLHPYCWKAKTASRSSSPSESDYDSGDEYRDNKSGEEVRLPMIAIDLCNDCRRATGSILPTWICCPMEYIWVCVSDGDSDQLQDVKDSEVGGHGDISEESDDKSRRASEENPRQETWVKATSVFLPFSLSSPTSPQPPSTLGTHRSSSSSTRYWCNKCGTPLAYRAHPMPAEWPEMLDILLGTIDREDLDMEDPDTGRYVMVPERVVWNDCAVNWTRGLLGGECRHLPVHTRTNVGLRRRFI
ncbi:18c97f34-50b1-4aba-9cbf-53ec0726f833 [Sclerotinia trifoliorum]|uniref:18c97f34-50b1-4aba-9cbf-53ec0726f833 n=1 Tax=Sclerotinia trifoliorum TaxID=28548 RepID=A0A8H2VPF7_9HELO|nr:18c97f34-50b1-4aba-9cbf-53ec0726f833 [Sclerotinia trifoliorum]